VTYPPLTPSRFASSPLVRMALPSTADLALAAASASRPLVVWLLSPELVVQEMAGQLAPLVQHNCGRHLFDILNSDDPLHPSIAAARLALRGEVVPYTTLVEGRTWEATYAPLFGLGKVLGAIGNAWQAPRQLRLPWWRERPAVFYATQALAGVEAGDIVILPEDRHEARRHSRLSIRAVEILLAAGALIPQNPAGSRLSVEHRLDARAATVRSARPHQPNPLRHLVRLK
jgi:hypothetical protein